MFIRTFVRANNEEEALKYLTGFENIISKCITDMKIAGVEQYWKFPDLYCVEYSFENVIYHQISEVIKELGENVNVLSDGTEYILADTTGEIYLENVEWILINLDKEMVI